MSEDTRNRLIQSAGTIFAEKGYEAASVREICQAAEANIAAVHYHFGEKRQLYVAAVREAQCCQAEAIPFPEWPADMPADERLRQFIRTMFERMLDADRPKWHLQLMLRELAHPTEACEAVVNDYIRPMADNLRSILRDLLPADLSEPERWRIGFSIVGQVLFYYLNQPIIRLLIGPDAHASLTVDDLANHVARFSLAALGYAPPMVTAAALETAP
ncbi:MAG TPA: CerR family C-terminal domain-containing protein [Planctomycetaceae bacterium]|nr:CerR family C-terminal domain-containing protein [Planctomycetaceae bacterium]